MAAGTTSPAREPLRTAVIGVGYLGRFHAEKYAALPESRLVAVVDQDHEAGRAVSEKLGVPALSDHRDLIGEIDAASIVVPTSLHHPIARDLLQHGIHVLVEKPMATTVEEADELISVARAHDCRLAVGHLERFNAAVLGLAPLVKSPLFIECHRISPFKNRAMDVDVVLDLMIHDIDIILDLVRSEVEHIEASGARVLSESIDIANARLNFANGCVANVTASRVSLKTERKMRIFQPDSYAVIDFQNRVLSQHVRAGDPSEPGIPLLESRETVYDDNDPLKAEIEAFLKAVRGEVPLVVSGEDGRRALATALRITAMLDTKRSTA